MDNRIITDLKPEDVILGRGAGPNEHSGNISFREIVQEFKPSYMATVNRKMKSKIAAKVVTAVKARRGRFLKRAPGHDDDDVFVVAEDEVVLEKAKQALRHGRCTVKPRCRNGGQRMASHHSVGSLKGAATCAAAPITSPSTTRTTSSMLNTQVAGSSCALPSVTPTVTPSNSTSKLTGNRLMAASLPTEQRNSSAAFPSVPSLSLTSLSRQPSPSTYELTLQAIMALAESKSRDASSSAECLQLLELVEALIAAKRASTTSNVASNAPAPPSAPTPFLNILTQLMLLSPQQKPNSPLQVGRSSPCISGIDSKLIQSSLNSYLSSKTV